MLDRADSDSWAPRTIQILPPMSAAKLSLSAPNSPKRAEKLSPYAGIDG